MLQHQWAELSEKWADVRDPAIKYGGGDREARVFLDTMAAVVAAVERREQELRGEPPSPLPADLPGVETIVASLRTREDVKRAARNVAFRLWMTRAMDEKGED